jgi:hypothetical protein
MLHAQFTGARGLREVEANLKSHTGKLPQLGGCTISKSALSDADAERPCEIFARLLSALTLSLQAGYRRKIGDCVRLIDSTSVKLNSMSGKWTTFSTGVCGAKAHIVYDPDANQPLYLMVTPSNVNDITAAGAKVRRPVVRIAGWRETKTLKPIDEVSLRGDYESPGRNESKRRSGLESE